MLACNYDASALGRELCNLDKAERAELVGVALGGKALSTLKKRCSQAYKYVMWCQEQDILPFPISANTVYLYLKSLSGSKGSFSKMKGAVECLNFLVHVLGVGADAQALKAPQEQSGEAPSQAGQAVDLH